MVNKTHDYTNRYWGHDYVYNPIDSGGVRARMMGWGHGINNGDYLLLDSNEPHGSTRYRVVSIVYKSDPSDMWEALVKFAPRTNGDE